MLQHKQLSKKKSLRGHCLCTQNYSTQDGVGQSTDHFAQRGLQKIWPHIDQPINIDGTRPITPWSTLFYALSQYHRGSKRNMMYKCDSSTHAPPVYRVSLDFASAIDLISHVYIQNILSQYSQYGNTSHHVILYQYVFPISNQRIPLPSNSNTLIRRPRLPP